MGWEPLTQEPAVHDPDELSYWCYTHQKVEPITWEPHPDHLRVGPMRRSDAEGWRTEATPWASKVLQVD